MAIADKLRKVASLFVVPDEEKPAAAVVAEPTPAPVSSSVSSAESSGGDISSEELDRRLAQMNATIRQINTGVTDTSTPPVTPLSPAPPIAPATVIAPVTPISTPQPPVSAQPQTIDDLLKRMDGPALSEVSVSSAEVPAPVEGGVLDFNAVYRVANLPGTPFPAEQMLEMINSFPENLPLDIKRQMVKATISTMGKTIGATPETIVADASRKLAALAAYETDHTAHAEAFATTTEVEIAELLAQVEEKRRAILAARQKDAIVRTQCDAESDRLDDILEFFSLDVGVSKYADPTATTPPPLPSGA